MGNVSVKQHAHQNKTRRHKLKNNTARNKPTINNRRRNKTRRGGAPSSLRKSITNRDGKAVTNSEELYTASKQPPLPPSFKSKQSTKSIKSKTKNKKDNETYAKYIENVQSYNVGDKKGLVYSVKRSIEKNVFPVVNQVNAYLKK
jgi:hypothetical protein